MSPRSPSRSTSLSRMAWVMVPPLLAVGYVWEQAQFAGPLYRLRQLALVAAAGAGDARGADLPLLAHRAAERREVLVVDHVDLVPAELAWLAPASAGRALASVPPAAGALLPATLLCHCGRTCLDSFSARTAERV